MEVINIKNRELHEEKNLIEAISSTKKILFKERSNDVIYEKEKLIDSTIEFLLEETKKVAMDKTHNAVVMEEVNEGIEKIRE